MKQHPGTLSISNFSYDLPEEKIAKFPLKERDSSRLLIYKDGEITDTKFSQLTHCFEKGDMLVFNQTRVVQARLKLQTKSGAWIEVFCLEPNGLISIPEAMIQKESATWFCYVGNAKKWKQEEVLEIQFQPNELLQLSQVGRKEDGYLIHFEWTGEHICFADILEIAGLLPLPPYLKRAALEEDKNRYQTVYANEKGSVAAPTAGLHFTQGVLDSLKNAGVDSQYLTLHIGAGTFKPVKADRMNDHVMHTEEIIASLQLIESIASSEGKIVAVGTTTLRSLESIYWTAVRLMLHPDSELEITVKQWDPYEVEATSLPTRKEAFSFLVQKMRERGLSFLQGETQIIIAPGYRIRTIDAIITNFHQPQSTLLLLVSACIGEEWRRIYDYALHHDYRFLSYGDSSLLFIK